MFRIDLTGYEAYSFKVLGFLGNNLFGKKGTFWECICKDCGNKFTSTSTRLGRNNKNNPVKNCGCRRWSQRFRQYDDPKQATYNAMILQYKNHAEEKNVKWSLTREQAINFYHGSCYYCGDEPSNARSTSRKNLRKKKANIVVVNGIDCKDPTKDYTISNCVSCCQFCNRMKLDHLEGEFYNKILKIVKHRNLIYTNLDKFPEIRRVVKYCLEKEVLEQTALQ